MKFTLCALALALSPLNFASTENSLPSSAGSGAVLVGQDLKVRFEFEAAAREDGTVTGRITIKDLRVIPDQDVDGMGESGLDGPPAGVELSAEVDSLKVQGRRAVLSGMVTSTNERRYAGLRLILTVEDNGEGGKTDPPDKITWGVYRAMVERHVADEENPDAGLYLIGQGEFDSNKFPVASYSLFKINEGNIQVRQ